VIPERYRRLREVLDRRQPDLTVLMERVHKPHNFSAILRNCDAVGVLEAHAVPPEGGLPLHSDTAAGSDKWIAVHRHEGIRTAADHLHGRGFQILAAHPDPDATDYREVDFTRPTAVMMGSELDGLSDEGARVADRLVVIPMAGMVLSLNVSVATAILLFEAYRQRSRAGMYDQPRLPPELYRRILFEWSYPKVARRYRDRGEAYPPLDPGGQILR
jgi:tRNA (guanosine-2'-O-)-methyltransferase